MVWWLARTAAALVVLAAGALLGSWVGALAVPAALAPVWGAAAGAGLAFLVLVVRDSLRGQSLMNWLRGAQAGPAPRDTGFWGELGYRVERALRQREQATLAEQRRLEQFLSAIEASPNGVMMLDEGGHIEWCNLVGAEHFGLDPQRDRRQRVTNLVRVPAFVAHLQAGRFDEAVVFPRPQGRGTLSVLVRRYGDGQVLVLSQDITERERSEGMRRDFVANVSHEIRTPLTVLSGFVETLQGLPLTEVERQRVLGLMAQQTDRMQNLVGDLLTLTRLEGSPRPPPDRWQPLGDVMQRAFAEARGLSAGRHALALEAGDEAEFAGSEAELHSALANLLNNAVRYTPEGGRITLGQAWRDEGGLELAVADTGVGIAREHLPRLTERFYRVDGSRSRDTGGTGLGLAIVKHVAQRHGGEIDIHSEPGKGSTFRLLLPAARVRRRMGGEGAPGAADAVRAGA